MARSGRFGLRLLTDGSLNSFEEIFVLLRFMIICEIVSNRIFVNNALFILQER